jgi:hypothetical protein
MLKSGTAVAITLGRVPFTSLDNLALATGADSTALLRVAQTVQIRAQFPCPGTGSY